MVLKVKDLVQSTFLLASVKTSKTDTRLHIVVVTPLRLPVGVLHYVKQPRLSLALKLFRLGNQGAP
jgi:hypothetical protein